MFNSLASKNDYRSFLSEALRVRYRGKANLSDFSRRAGFSSRSYLYELIKGKKGISKDSLLKIKSALKLPRPIPQVFELLVYEVTPTLRPRNVSLQLIQAKLKNLRNTLKNFKNAKSNVTYQRTLAKTLLHRVYAGLGDLSEGATLEEISKRTKRSMPAVELALVDLLKEGAVVQKDTRYFATQAEMDFFGIKPDQGLNDLVKEIGYNLSRDHKKICSDSTNFTFYSALSIQSSEKLKFKAQLKESLVRILDDFQTDNGDEVIEVFFQMNS